jgi:CRP/FNR family transcriptional regulator, cyclic AMP receptor protein
MTDAAFLRKLDLFNGLTASELAALAAVCRETTMNAGEVVLQQDRTSDELYVIVEGEVEILVGSRSCSDQEGSQTLSRLGAGQVFGEIALVDQGPRSATVRCAADGTRLLAVPRPDFVQLCEQNNHLGYIVMRNVAADLAFKMRTRNLAGV